MWLWFLKMPTQNLLMLLKLLMLMLRSMLATVCLRFWSISLVEILKWNFGRDSETEFQSTCNDLKAVSLVRALTPWDRCAFVNVSFTIPASTLWILCTTFLNSGMSIATELKLKCSFRSLQVETLDYLGLKCKSCSLRVLGPNFRFSFEVRCLQAF